MPTTTTSEEWNALADRAEAATGPDRELDATIGAALQRIRIIAAGSTGDNIKPCPDCPGVVLDKAGWWVAPTYTGSVDDAMRLVPEGWDWMAGALAESNHGRAYVANSAPAFIGVGTRPNPGRRWFEVCAPTPALALLAACCRAQADLAVQS